MIARKYTDSEGRKWGLAVRCRREPGWAALRVSEGERRAWEMAANVGRLSPDRKPRWSHVMGMTWFGSSAAKALCRDAGFDPDEDVGGEESWR